MPTLPDIVLVEIPAEYVGPTLPLGRYYPILVETDEEGPELDKFLARPLSEPRAPDIFDDRPSALHAERITIATYYPPLPDWPHLLLCHWPQHYTSMVQDRTLFARGAYTSEMFSTLAELEGAADRLMEVLGPEGVSLIRPIHCQAMAVGRA